MTHLRRYVWSLACAAVALAVVVGTAEARNAGLVSHRAKNLPVVPGSRYLALGDSVTFGYMESAVVPAPDYTNAASFAGYPEQLAAALHLSVANAACPGETSSSLVNPNGPSNGCENNPRHTGSNYRALSPLHVSYGGSQLAFGLSYLKHHRDVRLVSLMIGANDLFACQETTADHCATEQNATAATMTKNIHTILGSVRKLYPGQIVIVNYYSLNYASSAVNAQSQLLNSVLDAAAKPYGVEIANGFGEWGLASAHSSGSPCAAGLLTQTGAGTCGIHPSYAGQALLAAAVEKAIKLG